MAAESWYIDPRYLPEGDDSLLRPEKPFWAQTTGLERDSGEDTPAELISLQDVREGVNKLMDEKIVTDSLFNAYLEDSGIEGLVKRVRKIPEDKAVVLRDHYQHYTSWVQENTEWVTKQLRKRLKDYEFNSHKDKTEWLDVARAARTGVTKETLQDVRDSLFVIDSAIMKSKTSSVLSHENVGDIYAKRATAKRSARTGVVSSQSIEVAPKQATVKSSKNVIHASKEKEIEARRIPVSAIRDENGKVSMDSTEDLLRKAEAAAEERHAELAAQNTAVQTTDEQEVAKSVHILPDEREPIDLASKRRNPVLDNLVVRVDGGNIVFMRRDEESQTGSRPDAPRTISFFGRAITGVAALAAVGGAVMIPTTEAAAAENLMPNSDRVNATAPQDPANHTPKSTTAPSEAGATNAPYYPKEGSGVATLPYDVASKPNIEPVGDTASAEPSASSSPSAPAEQSKTNSPKSSEEASPAPTTEVDTSTAEPTDPEILQALDKAIADDLAHGKISESHATDLLQKILDANTELATTSSKVGASDAVTAIVREYLDVRYGTSSFTTQNEVPAKPAATTTAKSSETSTKSAAAATPKAPGTNTAIKINDPAEALLAPGGNAAAASSILAALKANDEQLDKNAARIDANSVVWGDVLGNNQADETYLKTVLSNPGELPKQADAIVPQPPVYGYNMQGSVAKETAAIAKQYPSLSKEQQLQLGTLVADVVARQLWTATAATEGGEAAYASVAPAFKKAQEEATKTAAPSHQATSSAATTHETVPAAGVTAEKVTVNDEYQKTLAPIAMAHKINVDTLYGALAYYNGNLSVAHTQPLRATQGWFGITRAEWDSPINNPNKYPFSSHDDLAKSAEIAANMLEHLGATDVKDVGTPEQFAEHNMLNVLLRFVHGNEPVNLHEHTPVDKLTQHEKNMVQQAFTALQNAGVAASATAPQTTIPAQSHAAQQPNTHVPSNTGPSAPGTLVRNGGTSTFVPASPHDKLEQMPQSKIPKDPNFHDPMSTVPPAATAVPQVTAAKPAAPAPVKPSAIVVVPKGTTPNSPAAKPAASVPKPAAPAPGNNIGAITLGGPELAAREKVVIAQLEKDGATPVGALAATANFVGESSLLTDAVGDKHVPGGTAEGIGQWRQNRKKGLPSTLPGQADFAMEELEKGYPEIYAMITGKKPASLPEIMTALVADYERPADPGKDTASRLKIAEALKVQMHTAIKINSAPAPKASTPKANGAPAAPALASQPSSAPAQPAAPTPIVVGPSIAPAAPAQPASTSPSAAPQASTPATPPASADKPAIAVGPTAPAPAAPKKAAPATSGRVTTKGETEPTKVGSVPYIAQTDKAIAHKEYSITDNPNQTIATSGCVPVAAAMAVAAATGSDPVKEALTAAQYSLQHGYRTPDSGTANSFVAAFAKAKGVPAQTVSPQNQKAIMDALKNGQEVVVTGTDKNPNTPATTVGHGYVITMDANGKVRVANPAKPHDPTADLATAMHGVTSATIVGAPKK